MIDMFYAISGINGDYEAYKRALKKLKFQNLDDIKEEDIMKIMSYNVMALPALVVDEQVVAKGRKLSLAEVKELLTK